MAPSNKNLFPDSKQKRENGTGLAIGYSIIWKGCNWRPLVAPAASLRKALDSGPSLSLAEELHPGPGLFELAIAPEEKSTKRVEVYLEATENLREGVKGTLSLDGPLSGCTDHALKNKHYIWVRYRTYTKYENAERDKDKILDKFDYAWLQQQYFPARTLMMKAKKFCGCCCRTGFVVIEGPSKLRSQGKKTSSFQRIVGRR
eukprot:jgi/Picsp_1/236/NSC_00235-R1_hypothetical protein ATCV1_Z174L [Acanthocystis turfacea Chlorella virus 1]